MAHTYNEQVLTIPAGGTLEDTAGLIRAGVAQLTGWTQDNEEPEYLNVTDDKQIRFRVYVSSGYIYFRAYYSKTIMLDGAISSWSRIGNISTTFRFLMSTDETVMWLGCDIGDPLYWLIAKNNTGKYVIFAGYNPGAMAIGTDSLGGSQRFYYFRSTMQSSSNMPGYTNNISIAQFADMWNGGSFPELYWVYGITGGYPSNNFHVAFGNKTYALVKMHGSNVPSQFIFAFPVSDE